MTATFQRKVSLAEPWEPQKVCGTVSPFSKGALLFFAGVLRSNTQVWLSVQQWEGWSDVDNRKWA